MDFNWSEINHLQLGKYGEYLAKMELTRNGFDIYTSEVDDRGIDFIIRTDNGNYYDIQVKSVRNLNYIFFKKSKFELRKNLFAIIVLFIEKEHPRLYLIPSLEWNYNLNKLLVSNPTLTVKV